MNLLFWGLTLGVVGKVLLAVGILKVHYEMAREHQIDEKVIRSFYLEKILTIVGIFSIIIGYLIELYFYGGIDMLFCQGTDCASAVGAIMAP